MIVGYADISRLLIAWCALRQGFRHFRTHRIVAAETRDKTARLNATVYAIVPLSTSAVLT